MKIERLRNKKSKLIFLCGFLMVVVLLITVVIKGSKAKYRSYQIIPLINGKITVKKNDLTIAVLWDGQNKSTFPPKGQGYIYDINKSSCKNGSILNWNEEEWSLNTKSISSDTCTIAFTYNLNFNVSYGNIEVTNNIERPRKGKFNVIVDNLSTTPADHYLTNYAYQLDNNNWIENVTSNIQEFTNVSLKGYHDVTVKGKDKYGNEGIKPIKLYLDNDAPNLALTEKLSEKNTTNNVWYKNLSFELKAEDLDNSIKEFKYCTTTNSDCTPNIVITNVNDENASRIVTKDNVVLSNNALSQTICMLATDYVNNTTTNGKACFTGYKVDNKAPSIGSVDIATSGKNANIQVKNVVEEHSGIASYSYQLDGNNLSNTGSTVNLTNLEVGNHTIKVIVKDNAGNTSTVTKEFTINNEVKKFLLGKWGKTEESITTRNDFGTLRKDGGNVVYKAPDDYGTSYYLVGNPQNNWVKFGGFYWRIMRINGDGSLRMIYSGSNATGPQTTGAGTQIGTSAFNETDNGTEYIGYWYTIGQKKGLGTSSKIYKVVNDFYNNISNKEYIDKNTSFCNDRTEVSGGGNLYYGIGFAAANRTLNSMSPILTCSDNNDFFTASSADRGNKKLANPIGLISADEVLFGGLLLRKRDGAGNYLYTGSSYYTMSPLGICSYLECGSTSSVEMIVDGTINNNYCGNMTSEYGVRPVISLVKSVAFSKGNGSISSPFEI